MHDDLSRPIGRGRFDVKGVAELGYQLELELVRGLLPALRARLA